MSLYRTYRPKTFAELAGQEPIKQTLKNEIALGKTVHAYLFSGPRAVGKTSTARIFVRAVNCLKRIEGESEPCNKCAACTALLEGRSLDVLEIDAASHTGVDNVRDNIIVAARVANSSLKVKAFIIDEVHMLSTAAFNALLKLLEEPPGSVVFILATTELHKVPATIISRCQRFDFKKIPAVEMKKRLKKLCKLEKREVDEEVVDEIIRLSDGCLRDAESLLGQLLTLDGERITASDAAIFLPRSNRELVKKLMATILVKDVSAGVAIVDQLIEEGVDLTAFTNDCIEYCRWMLLAQSGTQPPDSLPQADRESIKTATEKLSPAQILILIEHLVSALREARFANIKQLPLEMALVRASFL
ncbi:MAG: DNA polymerase III subunit gamma/tau [Patescibacteria group bacterium]|mgnify:CR=1 FL=1